MGKTKMNEKKWQEKNTVASATEEKREKYKNKIPFSGLQVLTH